MRETMFTDDPGDYPDIHAELARLEAEDPPAHVRAQRLATLHVAMALASHRAIVDLRRVVTILQASGETRLDAVLKTHDASSTKIQRSLHDLRQSLEARVGQGEQAVLQLRQDLTRGQERRLGPLLGAYVGGALIGVLLLAALWLGLGQTMRVHVLPPPPVNGQQKGQ